MTQQIQSDQATMSMGSNSGLTVSDVGEPLSKGSDAAASLGVGPRLTQAGRWFLLVFTAVILLELLVAIPMLANHRRTWLFERASVARTASLLMDAASVRPGPQEERIRAFLDASGAKAIALEGQGGRWVLGSAGEAADFKRIDIAAENVATSLTAAMSLLFADASRPVWIAAPKMTRLSIESTDHRLTALIATNISPFTRAELLVDEAPLQESLQTFSVEILVALLSIAAAVAGLVSLAVQRSFLQPMRQLAGDIGRFANDPEGIEHLELATGRRDAIGEAETALTKMQWALAGELRERRRLAGLGLSVSKINHELRNLLTTAQLLGDRLEGVADPIVQRVAPRLIATLDRAIRFCEATLAYGRATEPYPQRRRVLVEPLLSEMEDLAGLSLDARLRVEVRAEPDVSIYVDPEQFSRALTNIVRNAVQALDAAGAQDVEPLVTITAFRQKRDGEGGRVVILLADNGPGLPQNARATLFAPFQGSMRAGGTGLGLAIASELVSLNGGTLELDDGTSGACFRIVVPDGDTA